MKVTRTLRFELGQDELANVEELVIVLNPGNGAEPKYLTFDQDFNLVSHQSLLPAVKMRRHYKSRKTEDDVSRVITATNNEESAAEIVEEVVNEKPEEAISEPFIKAITTEDSDFLLPVPACEKDLQFRNTKITPYSMTVTHDSLENFIKKFIYNKKSGKLFEDKIYAFYINDLGTKFQLKTVNAWCAGLWMVIDPYGFKEACGGKVTYRAIEFAFRDIRSQLEERVIRALGHLPKPVKPLVEDKRKTRFKKTS